MKTLKVAYHPSIKDLSENTVFKRLSTRAIVVDKKEILLLYTKRYNDYSLPGGGIDADESIEEGLIRELSEETGAKNIKVLSEFGIYEEYRPWYKPDFDIVHMISYCFVCSADKELGDTKYENYEINNGMKPVWINIHEAIKHNEMTLKNDSSSGLSIEREIFLLKEIAKTLI